jgi:hypothetical protein
MKSLKILLSVAAMIGSTAGLAQTVPAAPTPSPYSYADLADLALSGPILAELRIRKAEKLPPANPQVAQTRQRYLILADVTSVIRGTGGLPPRVEFLYDARRDAQGRLPKLNKARVIVAALPVAGKPTSLQLASPEALIMAVSSEGGTLRSIVRDVIDPAAPPAITGVGSAFHVPGTLEGEGDSQIFLTTRDGRPISFNVVRTPASAPRWSVSIDELVDMSAAQPRRDTLLWYRLACFLPATLPVASTEANPEYAAILSEDYQTVKRGLGTCRRTRTL